MTHRSRDTPLSDLIAALEERYTNGSYRRFIAAFREARVGVVVVGAPENAIGDIAVACRPEVVIST